MRKMEFANVEEITFGVEIETHIPRGTGIDIGSYHHGLRVYQAPAFDGEYWRAERDGSIRATDCTVPCEFVSPILKGAAGVRNLIEMAGWLNGLGAKVNASCGLHIHIGLDALVDRRSTEKIADYLAKLGAVAHINMEAVYSQTGTRRDENSYCAKLGDRERDQLRSMKRSSNPTLSYSIDRYRMLNLRNVRTIGTVEFRAFAGTTNVEKVLHHLWTCLFITKFAAELKNVPWTTRGWNSEAGGAGEKALRGLHCKMGKRCLIGDMVTHRQAMKKVALQMAAKYDNRIAD